MNALDFSQKSTSDDDVIVHVTQVLALKISCYINLRQRETARKK